MFTKASQTILELILSRFRKRGKDFGILPASTNFDLGYSHGLSSLSLHMIVFAEATSVSVTTAHLEGMETILQQKLSKPCRACFSSSLRSSTARSPQQQQSSASYSEAILVLPRDTLLC